MTRVRAVAEIVLNCRDLGAMTRFYETVLGFPVIAAEAHPDDAEALGTPDAPTTPTIVFLKIADLPAPFGVAHPQTLVLIDPARHRYAKGRFEDPARKPSRLNHVAFQIDAADYAPELARLRGLGLEPTETEFPNFKARAMFIEDPEQNSIELICHEPG